LLDENGIGVLMFLEEKIEGRKVQFLPFLLSKNMRKYTLKNTGFCPNKVIHFSRHYGQELKCQFSSRNWNGIDEL